jgi:hypothetical protein
MMLLALLLASTGPVITAPHSPHLPVFGSGPAFNIGRGDDVANGNAINHVWSSALIVVGGERLTGSRRGLWITIATYSTLKLVHESCFHNGAGPEVRTDLVSSIGTAVLTGGFYEAAHALGWIHWKGNGP